VQRLLGKELLVLLWAIEQQNVSDEETAVAIRNWLGLKPEERWWLYTMTAAATGFAHQAGMGWRNALRMRSASARAKMHSISRQLSGGERSRRSRMRITWRRQRRWAKARAKRRKASREEGQVE